MSASDHLGRQFISVSRGIKHVSPDTWEDWTGDKGGFKLDKTNLGTHWSTKPDVAKGFTEGQGSIFHGRVAPESIVTDRNEQVRMGADDIHGEYAHEKEIPVRRGSSVLVHQVDSVKTNRVRKRTYKQPREMKA